MSLPEQDNSTTYAIFGTMNENNIPKVPAPAGKWMQKTAALIGPQRVFNPNLERNVMAESSDEYDHMAIESQALFDPQRHLLFHMEEMGGRVSTAETFLGLLAVQSAQARAAGKSMIMSIGEADPNIHRSRSILVTDIRYLQKYLYQGNINLTMLPQLKPQSVPEAFHLAQQILDTGTPKRPPLEQIQKPFSIPILLSGSSASPHDLRMREQLKDNITHKVHDTYVPPYPNTDHAAAIKTLRTLELSAMESARIHLVYAGNRSFSPLAGFTLALNIALINGSHVVLYLPPQMEKEYDVLTIKSHLRELEKYTPELTQRYHITNTIEDAAEAVNNIVDK